jgi:hypothetical protein
MGALDKFISSVNHCETVVIIDSALNSFDNEPFLRSLPLIKMASIDTVTFPKSKAKIYSLLPIETVKWIDSRTILDKLSGGFAIYTNQWLENHWTSKPLINKINKNPQKGIIVVIPDTSFKLNQAMRPFLDENITNTRNVYSYQTLMDELRKNIYEFFHISITEEITPILLESLCYLSLFEKTIPNTSKNLLNLIKTPKGHNLDFIIKHLAFNSHPYHFEDLVDAIYWQIGCTKRDVSSLVHSWQNKKQLSSNEYYDLIKKHQTNMDKILIKISSSHSLKMFFSRNIEELT